MSSAGRTLRALPTLFRVGLAEMFAYRAEFIVWVLTTNMPLVMMALWTAVAAGGPVSGYGQRDFVAYFLAILIIRIVTNNWLVWQLTMEIRQGTLAARLVRPIHPVIGYAAQHLAAVPMRLLIVTPAWALLIATAGRRLALFSPAKLAIFVTALAGAWLLQFAIMWLIGTLALYLESALSLFDLWLGCHFVLSGYLVPLDLFPAWTDPFVRALPFRYLLAFPAELLIGKLDLAHALTDLRNQWLFVGGLFLLAGVTWRAGMRRLVAYGG